MAKYPVEGEKRGFLSYKGTTEKFMRYLKGLKVIKEVSDREKPEDLRRSGAI